jgi:dCTP deaminase
MEKTKCEGANMGLKNDRWIVEKAKKGMITPYCDTQVSHVYSPYGHTLPQKVVSYGVSSYGYDMRVADGFKIFSNVWPGIIDPKNFDVRFIEETAKDGFIVVPPNSFALAQSVEYFKIPRGVLTICLGKSTYARCGIVANITAFEPEWEGTVTIEISNTTPLPAKIYVNEGIAQVLFFEGDEECQTSYKDKKGKYQAQTGITLPKV